MKGYKVFNSDWTCRNYKYEVGKTYEMEEHPICCNNGFHFCTNLSDCFNYYGFNTNNKVAEIEALGEIGKSDDDTKHCTNKIKIVRELAWEEVLTLCNSGNRNSGDCNSGDWNITSFSNGCFNTYEPKIYLFDKPSDWTYRDWLNSDARYILNCMPTDVIDWVCSDDMTDEEIKEHPEHETTGGFLRTVEKSSERQTWWNDLGEHWKNEVKSIPNFDEKVFERITGIKIG